MTAYFHRHNEVQRVRNDLERDGFPRLQMLLLVTLTGGTGFIASYSLLHAGLVEMWLRYLAAFGIAYLMFLVFLWLWLRTKAEDYCDGPDLSDLVPARSRGSSTCGEKGAAEFEAGGGQFGGGGASGSFTGPQEPLAAASESSSIGDTLGTVAEAEEFAIPLVVLIVVAAMVASSFFMIYSAPALFAELLVDGVLSATLYRRLRGLESRHWLETAVRRTALPFVLTAAAVSASGWGMRLYAPEAKSIGDVVTYYKAQ